jgi:hypothetical protein
MRKNSQREIKKLAGSDGLASLGGIAFHLPAGESK